jgi:hypothetical protein
MSKNTIPKTIWIFWMQGFENAPFVVKICLESWQKYNSNWKVVKLDQENVHEYISDFELYRPDRSVAAMSDVLRINLLNKFGGVWVDATLFCTKPLDSWLEIYSRKNGFLATDNTIHLLNDTRKVGTLRIGSYFLVSSKSNYVTKEVCDLVNEFWKYDYSISIVRKLLNRLILIKVHRYYFMRFMTQRKTLFYSNYVNTRIIKIVPYHWFHYLYNRLYYTNNTFKLIQDQMKSLNPNPIGMLGKYLLSSTPVIIKNEIEAMKTPFYKLTYKGGVDFYSDGSTIDFLLKTHNLSSENDRD